MLNFKSWVNRLDGIPEQSAKFVNTLSLLEYMGARKIVKSQHAASISFELMAHISEEIRHAEILKKLALKMSDGKLTTYSDEHLLCGSEARAYIQTVDRAAEELFGTKKSKEVPKSPRASWLNYLYTTLLLEERAKQIYPHCGALVEKQGFQNVFKGILKEEDRHLSAVSQEMGVAKEVTPQILDTLKRAEYRAFDQFLLSLSQSLELCSISATPVPFDNSHTACMA